MFNLKNFLMLMLITTSAYSEEILAAFYFNNSGSFNSNKSPLLVDASLTPNLTSESSKEVTPLQTGLIDDGSYLINHGVLYLNRKGWGDKGNKIWGDTFANSTGPFSISITAGNTDIEITSFEITQVKAKDSYESNSPIFFALHEKGSTNRSDSGSIKLGSTSKGIATFISGDNKATGSILIAAGQTKSFNLRINTKSAASQHILDNFVLKGSVLRN